MMSKLNPFKYVKNLLECVTNKVETCCRLSPPPILPALNLTLLLPDGDGNSLEKVQGQRLWDRGHQAQQGSGVKIQTRRESFPVPWQHPKELSHSQMPAAVYTSQAGVQSFCSVKRYILREQTS